MPSKYTRRNAAQAEIDAQMKHLEDLLILYLNTHMLHVFDEPKDVEIKAYVAGLMAGITALF